MPIKEAIVETLNQAFPTIITSGSILAAAGILIGFLSSDGCISSIGICLGRGTIISIGLVMAILPQLLILGDIIIEKTAFTLKKPAIIQTRTGSMRVDGHVKGYISGMVDGNFTGTLNGTINAKIESGTVESTDPLMIADKKKKENSEDIEETEKSNEKEAEQNEKY